MPTHKVTNQPPPLQDYNLYDTDPGLREALHRENAGWAEEKIRAFGALAGSAEVIQLGAEANRYPPELRSHDRFGNRIDEVYFHPAYHKLMALGVEHGIHSVAWTTEGGGYVAHTALEYLLTQAEAGVCCPITMTNAAVPVLRHHAELAAEWEPHILATEYDPRNKPIAEKTGATIGMAMTEKQGGSDVRTNSTRAIPLESGGYRLVGHKWFCSAPMSDGFLTLAQSDGGLSCFFVARWRPDGTRNALYIQRLKDKTGNRSNASAEIEYDNAYAVMVGEEGHGVATIMDMVQNTRLDSATGSAGLMRQSVVQAVHHAAHRMAFGKKLIEQPLMANVLADMVLETEAATALIMRVARAFDAGRNNTGARAFARLSVALAKFWITKRLPGLAYEAMECLGGNGYVEESPMPRIYREAPVNSIWEGAGNIICLDVLRAVQREPESLEAFWQEVESAKSASKLFDRALKEKRNALTKLLQKPPEAEPLARQVVVEMVLLLQGALLARYAPDAVSQAFCASRLSVRQNGIYGTLPPNVRPAEIIARAQGLEGSVVP